MLGLFKQAKAAPPPQETLKRLREVLDTLEKRENYLTKKVDDERGRAGKLATSNRREALMALKRKKLYEGQIEKLNGARSKLDAQIIAIESASTNLVILDAMSDGAQAMKQINRQMTVEKVEDIMDDIQDQMMVAEEIGTAIAQPIGSDSIDDSELEAELDALAEENNLQNELGKMEDHGLDLPNVPSKNPKAKVVAAAQPVDPFAGLAQEMDM